MVTIQKWLREYNHPLDEAELAAETEEFRSEIFAAFSGRKLLN